jgi:hypothetical protein
MILGEVGPPVKAAAEAPRGIYGIPLYSDEALDLLAHVEERSFPGGIPIHADHDYELITVYDNRGAEDIDAMAILYLYLYDRTFEPPAGV